MIDDPLYNIERKVDTIGEKVDRLDRKADAAADQLDGIEGLMTANIFSARLAWRFSADY